MYQTAGTTPDGATSSNGTPGSGKAAEGDVVDAEFKEV
jgi:hypothetical protein